MQNGEKAGYMYMKDFYFWVWNFGDFIVCFVGKKNTEIFVQNEYTQCLLLDMANIVIIV